MNEATNAATGPFQYVPIGDFREHDATVEATLQSRVDEIWQSLHTKPDNRADIFQPIDSLDALPAPLLHRIAPPPDRVRMQQALDMAIAQWQAQPVRSTPILLVVGAPDAGDEEVLRNWAEAAGWQTGTPPTPEQILAHDATWLGQLPAAGKPWVLPALERCFLRHIDGISLLRALLARIFTGDSQVIVGCNSWAFAYLRHLWHSWPAPTITLQALDSQALATWFDHLANREAKRRFLFRQSDNGAYVLPAPEQVVEAGTAAKQSDYLQRLALYSRGNPTVAWAIWRQSLLADADDLPPADAAENGDGNHTVIWVSPWERVKHPTPLPNDRSEQALLLHALLLHDGLTGALLQKVLPLAPDMVAQTLLALQMAGLIEQHDATWRVSAVGYPTTRLLLKNAGYLTDKDIR
jgi:hypothetical protein